MNEKGYGAPYGGMGGILLRSRSVKDLVEQKKNDNRHDEIKFVVIVLVTTTLFMLYVATKSIVPGLDSKPLGVLIWLGYMIFALVSAANIFLVTKPLKEFYEKYLGYSGKEDLIVTEQGIYGADLETPFHLEYQEISSVTTQQNTDKAANQSTPSIDNDLLIIQTTSAREFRFCSFANSRELAFMIDEQRKKNIPRDIKMTDPPESSSSTVTGENRENTESDESLRAAGPSESFKPPETKVAFYERRPEKLVCPNCGLEQRSNRNVCYQCGCKFVFGDTMEE